MVKRRQIAHRLVKEKQISLAIALKVMSLSKASYYYTPSNRSDYRKRPLDSELAQQLQLLSRYALVYGYRKVSKKFKVYNHKKVYRHMKELNMLQPKKIKKKRKTRLVIDCPIAFDIRSRR